MLVNMSIRITKEEALEYQESINRLCDNAMYGISHVEEILVVSMLPIWLKDRIICMDSTEEE